MSKKLHTLPTALLFVFIVFISGCGENGDIEPLQCGSETEWLSTTVFQTLIYSELDIVSGNRIFVYEDISTPDNICIDEPTTAIFTAYNTNGDPGAAGIVTKAKAYCGQSGEYMNTMVYSQSSASSQALLDIDLSSQFSTNPAWIGLQVKFEFPTQGSFTVDSIFIHNHVSSIKIRYPYHIAP